MAELIRGILDDYSESAEETSEFTDAIGQPYIETSTVIPADSFETVAREAAEGVLKAMYGGMVF